MLAYCELTQFVKTAPRKSEVNPRAVFANYELDLRRIGVYGFDYDYTLAVYTKHLNDLVYELAVTRLVEEFKYPKSIKYIPSDLYFATRGLHYDVKNSVLLKVDAFNQIQKGSVYKGKRRLTLAETRSIYPNMAVKDNQDHFPLLLDLFSLPWAGLLATVVQYFVDHQITFDPVSLYNDIASCVERVHTSGDLYKHVTSDLERYIHRNEELKEYLDMLVENNRELFVITNSPFYFMNVGMKYMLGDDWLKYFKYVIVSSKKPSFFSAHAPFREYNPKTDEVSYQKVTNLVPYQVYSGGNMMEFLHKADLHGKGVLYFGDHIYSDLAEPILKLGWHTAAIVPELAREIRMQNTEEYRQAILLSENLTCLIQKYQRFAVYDKACAELINSWVEERRELREQAKSMFNPRFGSMFRTFHSMSYFYWRLSRLADIYTSRLPNMLVYGTEHTFFPRRNALPHEMPLTVPESLDDTYLHEKF
uniref:5'-nucleotidase domain-containing protein 3 n=1 Tax=Panagrellus redivivus TaxID=6233 RepID=A0A7E4ZZ04_PANRE